MYDISNNTITKYYTPYSVGVSALVQFKDNIFIESFYSIGMKVLKLLMKNKLEYNMMYKVLSLVLFGLLFFYLLVQIISNAILHN